MRITDFTELTTPTSNDLLVVVDVVNDITKKLKLSSLPVSTSVTTALATKQDTLVSGTNIKTVNSITLLGSGDIVVQTPLVSGTSIKTVNSNSLLGGGDIAVQPTLVSGTNIKTINSTSLLGSGNITIAASPSGVAGAIQFSNGSAFASDAANLFWDDTNNRFGVGTNTPSTALHVVGQTTFSDNALFSADFKYIGRDLNNSSIRFSQVSGEIRANISTGGQFHVYNAGSGTSRFGVSSGGQTTISGGGSTSATTSLLVQNSAGTSALTVKDDLSSTFGGNLIVNSGSFIGISNTSRSIVFDSTNATNLYTAFGGHRFSVWNTSAYVDLVTITGNSATPSLLVGTTTANNSAIVNISSTTQGFLPPRMTTTQKNAIASPAAGLVVYDSTTNKLCCYNGSTWNDLF